MSQLEFRLDASHPESHRLRVTLEADRGLWGDVAESVELFMPTWTPGSYLVREHARHVERFFARDSATGTPLAHRKSAKNRWQIDIGPAVERLAIEYEVYAHELTVRTADLTESHAFWNGACILLWPHGAGAAGAEFEIVVPDGWSVATQLARIDGDGHRFRAANLDDAVDAPVLAGHLEVLRFRVLGVDHSFVIDGLAGIDPPASLITDATRIIERAAAIFGGSLPYDSYQFLSLFADRGRGGLEHTCSSALLAPRTTFYPANDYREFLGLVAHEFFHVWNVKRMRPQELWSFDYEIENYTTLLWVAEGFTAYYDDLLCVRAGVLPAARYLEIVAENIAAVHRNPGRHLHPLADASFDAWIKLYRPDENSRNSTQSYYVHGALAAMCLDLRVRCASAGERSLDDAVRELYARTYAAGRGYVESDVVACLSEAAGEDLAPLVDALVHGPFDPDFTAVLAQVGLELVAETPARPTLGVQLRAGETVVASVTAGSPAADAGLAPGDELLAIQGLRVTSDTLLDIIAQFGDTNAPMSVLVSRRGRVLEAPIAPTTGPPVVKIREASNAKPRQVRLRDQWLHGPAE